MPEVGNWIAETSATTGTGNIVVNGAVDLNHARFRDAFGAIEVFYSIQDGDSREAGFATFNGNDTLANRTPTATYINLAYNNTNPSPLNLSGAAIISCTLNASAFKALVGGTNGLQAQIDANTTQITINSGDISVRETAATGITIDTVTSMVTSTTVQVAAGAGEIVDAYTDRSNPTETDIAWPLIPSITINMPDNFGVQTIYAQDDGTLTGVATVLQKAGILTPSERRTLVQIAQVYYEDGAIIEPVQIGIHSNEVGNSLYDYINYVELVNRTKGIAVNAVTGALSIYGDAGTIFIIGIETDVDKTNPNIGNFAAINDINTAATFDVVYADGSDFAVAQTVMPEAYESAPGVATPLSGNDAVIHYVYRTIGNTFIVQLGNRNYATAALARDSVLTDRGTHSHFTGAEFALLSAQVYLENNASDFSDSTSAGIISLLGGSGGGAASSVTVVDNLLGNGDTTSALSANQGYQLDQAKLNLSGGTMTGSLTISTTGASTLDIVASAGFVPSVFFQQAGTLRGVLRYNDNGTITLDNRSSGSALTTTFTDDGNVLIGGAQSAAADSLTRKDYVDGLQRITTRAVSASTTLLPADEGNAIEINNAGAVTLSFDSAQTYPVGMQGIATATGVGAITMNAVGTTTFKAAGGLLTTALQERAISFYHIGSNVWRIMGDLV